MHSGHIGRLRHGWRHAGRIAPDGVTIPLHPARSLGVYFSIVAIVMSRPALQLLASLSLVLSAFSADARRTPPNPIDVPQIARPQGESAQWWFRAGAATAASQREGARPRARNVIVFIGDGMSLPTLAAARILEGQRHGASGEEQRLSFEDFPHTALSRTYNTDAQTPDSAGTMTAIATGAKTRMGMISMGQAARRGDCASAENQELVTLMELAELAGMATGIVTTTRITHATPAATFAHTPERNWESDGLIPASERAHGCIDIARQLVEFPFGDGIDLALGGGRSHFLPGGHASGKRGLRRDERDLIAEWTALPGAAYVEDAVQLAAADPRRTRRLLGLFAADHLQFDHDRRIDARGQPSLAQMTCSAIGFLRDRPKGYVLMIEGGRIDHAHHFGNAYRALDDTIALSDAVRVATELTSAEDTLILVTADHGHTMTFSGYPARGNPILGLVRGSGGEGAMQDIPAHDALGRPYTTLAYANGPGYAGASAQQAEGAKRHPHAIAGVVPAPHADLADVDTTAADFLQPAALPLESETHGGDDVAVFARGPGAEAVRGSLEQNVLFHLIVQAQPRLRATLCALDACEAGKLPARLVPYARLQAKAASSR